MDDMQDFLGEQNSGSSSKEAKWNMFFFQHHLVEWVHMSSIYFQERDYPNAFEALTILYTDCIGFFDKKEKEVLKDLFEKAIAANNEYLNYNINYTNVKHRVKNQIYKPPTNIYYALLNFRLKLMEYLSGHQVLMRLVNKKGRNVGAQ